MSSYHCKTKQQLYSKVLLKFDNCQEPFMIVAIKNKTKAIIEDLLYLVQFLANKYIYAFCTFKYLCVNTILESISILCTKVRNTKQILKYWEQKICF